VSWVFLAEVNIALDIDAPPSGRRGRERPALDSRSDADLGLDELGIERLPFARGALAVIRHRESF
jgi:hypothetical protein